MAFREVNGSEKNLCADRTLSPCNVCDVDEIIGNSHAQAWKKIL